MAGEKVAGVFHADTALDKRLDEIAPRSEDADNKAQTGKLGPRPRVERVGKTETKEETGCYGNQKSAEESFPGFLGRYALEKTVTSELRTYEIGTGVAE